MDEDESNIAWEDDDEDIEWEKEDEDDAFTTETTPASLAKCNSAGVKDLAEDREKQQQHQEEEKDEPEERRWLGENGEIVVELPREGEDGDFDILEGNVVSAAGEAEEYIGGDGDQEGRTKQKGKTKGRRFTPGETRLALNVHKAHLVCLVARCSLVSHWANDAAVRAAMVSCLPTQIIYEIKASGTCREDPLGGAGSSPRESDGLRLTSLVVWFRRFMSILDDDAVGGGSGGDRQWGSRPARLLKVIEQRVGCAQEAVQLFVAVCRGLGLRTRYVACLDPLPPHPVSGGTSKRRTGRNSTGSSVTIDLTSEERHRTRRRRGGGDGGGPGGRTGLGVRSRAWAEVLCCEGESGDLYVVTFDTNEPVLKQLPVKRLNAVESKSQSLSKRARPSSSCSNSDHAADPRDNAPSPGNVGGSGGEDMVGSRRKRSERGRGRGLEGSKQSPKEEDDDVDTKFGVSTRSKRKALASVTTVGRAVGKESHQGGRAETEPEVKSPAQLDDHDRVLAAAAAAERGGGSSSGSGSDPVDECSRRDTPGKVRERWVHVDPVEGAVDQASKVQDLRFRKRLMPYVVAEDEKRRIVDVTRRYSTEWSRTLRTRGRVMASSDGWWNRALRLWGTSSNGVGKTEMGNGRADNPLVVDGGGAEDMRDEHASEEIELQEKVDSEPVPSTIAALKNHHVYVLGKNLLKHEGLRPGAKVAGLVRGCKVFLKSDVARLKGASRWKLDGLKVKDSEVEKPAKVTTKKGEKDGEGTNKLYGEWQTEPWTPDPAVNGKVPKNEYGNVEFFECSPALLPAGTEHIRGDQISRVASKLGVDYAPALTGFEMKQGRQVPVLDGIIVCKEHCQMLRDAHMAWEQAILEKRAKAREQKLLKRWRTLILGVLEGKRILEEYGSHN